MHTDIIRNPSCDPAVSWGINDLPGNFYKESGSFTIEDIVWKLAISYFQAHEDALKVTIKLD
jgi:hypothetical protein